jgi:hypothetical protein
MTRDWKNWSRPSITNGAPLRFSAATTVKFLLATYPNPCCRCGFCCISETCPAGQKVYRVQREDRCPGLFFEDGLAVCKLARNAGETQARFVLGIGAGCCIKARAMAKGITYDFAMLPPHIKRTLAQGAR